MVRQGIFLLLSLCFVGIVVMSALPVLGNMTLDFGALVTRVAPESLV